MKTQKIKFVHIPAKRIPEKWSYVEFDECGDYVSEYNIEHDSKTRGWTLSDGMEGDVIWRGPSLRICKYLVRVLVKDPTERIWINTLVRQYVERRKR